MSNGAWFGLGFLAAYFAGMCAVIGRIAWIATAAWRSVKPERRNGENND